MTITARLTADGPRYDLEIGSHSAVGLGEFAALVWLADRRISPTVRTQLLSDAAYDAHTRQIATLAVAL